MTAKTQERKFEITEGPAVRQAAPLTVGLMGPSGGGKTFSALRLATGIQRVVGGDLGVIDTESRRALHYADRFKFRHLDFRAPFGSLDYLAAIQQMAAAGCRTVIVDSMSHEHEGPGGMLDYHEAELERMAGDDYGKRERVKMLAWAKPKAARRALLNGMNQVEGVNLILCFRAKETAKPVKDDRGRTEVVQQGFMPIAGDEFVFDMTLCALLLPNAGGVPTWKSENPGERMMIKLPIQFRRGLEDNKSPLDEDLGERLARWAAGDAQAKPQEGRQSPPSAEGSKAPERSAPPAGAREERQDDGKATESKPAPSRRQGEPSEFLIMEAEKAGTAAAQEEAAERVPPEELSTKEAEAWLKAFDAELERQDAAAAEIEERQDAPPAAEEEKAADPPAEEEGPPNPFVTFAEALADSKSWADIYSALKALTTSEAFKAAAPEQQARARMLAYGRIEELNARGAKIDVLTDAHAFRCYVEAEASGETLAGMFATFKKQAAWAGLTADAQRAFEGAVGRRIAALQSIAENAGEFA